jgi:hypothetical protein
LNEQQQQNNKPYFQYAYKIVLENLINPLYLLVNNVIKVDDQILEAFFRINSTNNIPKKKKRRFFFKFIFEKISIQFLQVKPKREDPLHSDILRNVLEELEDL